MLITEARTDDIEGLARLIWLDTLGEEPAPPSLDAFAGELGAWWAPRRDTHVAFVARHLDGELVGMAWVALLARVPRPGATGRMSADVQSVFVLPGHRGHGVGSALVEAATRFAVDRGALRTTVHSGRRAVGMYARLGFESSPQLRTR